MSDIQSNVIENIYTPVHPKLFVKQFTTKFQKWGNTITKELRKTWTINCLVFNNVIAKKDQALKYIVSAPTGSAKTENTITYCSMLPSDTKALISTNLIAEANRIVDAINEEAGDRRAISFHSSNKVDIDIASRYQIVVATHAFYKNNFAGTNKWNKIMSQRDLVIIDEALSTMEESSVSVNELNVAVNFFEAYYYKKYKDNDRYQFEFDKLSANLQELRDYWAGLGKSLILKSSDRMFKYMLNGTNKIVLGKSIKTDAYSLFNEILSDKSEIQDNENINFSHLLTNITDESLNAKIKANLQSTIEKLNDYKDRQVYITNTAGECSYNRVVDKTPNQSLVCFDATADINHIYKLRSEIHKDLILVPRVPNTRDYSSVVLHVSAAASTGKDFANTSIANEILSSVTLGDKTFIVTHKNSKQYFEEFISEHNDKTIEINHWGAITGLNQWQDFDTCVIAGLNHKPATFAQNRSIVNTNEHMAFGSDQTSINETIKMTDITAEIIQAMNRIRIRKVISSDGKCASANIYLMLPVFNYSGYTQHIREHMTNINIVEWNLKLSAQYVRKSYFEQTIEYLTSNLSIGDKVSIYQPREKLSIDKETYRSIIGKGEKDKLSFQNKMLKLGFDIFEEIELDSRGRTKKNKAKYIKRIS